MMKSVFEKVSFSECSIFILTPYNYFIVINYHSDDNNSDNNNSDNNNNCDNNNNDNPLEQLHNSNLKCNLNNCIIVIVIVIVI